MNVLSGDFYGGSRTPPGSVDSNGDWLDAAARTAFRSTGSDRLSPTPEPTSVKQAGPPAVAPSVITSPRASSRVAYLSLTKCSACPNAVLDPAQSLCEVSTFTPLRRCLLPASLLCMNSRVYVTMWWQRCRQQKRSAGTGSLSSTRSGTQSPRWSADATVPVEMLTEVNTEVNGKPSTSRLGSGTSLYGSGRSAPRLSSNTPPAHLRLDTQSLQGREKSPEIQCQWTAKATSLLGSARTMPEMGNSLKVLVKELHNNLASQATFMEEHSVRQKSPHVHARSLQSTRPRQR